MEKALTIEEVHHGTLDILKKIIEITTKIGVDYYVMYGSLIGAARHQGFIPWDDDFDIIMLREDYEKFISYCNEHHEELGHFRVFNRDNTPGYPFNISRFCDTRYRMVSEVAPDAGMGIFIDIYPLDTVKESKPSKFLLYKKKLLMILIFECYQKSSAHANKGFKTIVWTLIRMIARLFGANFWLNQLEHLKDRHTDNEGKYVTCLVWDDHNHYKKSYFEEYTFMKFEDLEIKVSKDYDTLLRTEYGDYMQLPPVEKRTSSHNYALYRKES